MKKINLKVPAFLKKIDAASALKWGGLGLGFLGTILGSAAEKKQNEAYLNKLFNEKFGDKN